MNGITRANFCVVEGFFLPYLNGALDHIVTFSGYHLLPTASGKLITILFQPN